MTPDDPRLTAYALNDPGLSAADREQVEAALKADPAARQAVEETRALAGQLAAALAAEQAALPAEAPIAVPSSLAGKPEPETLSWRATPLKGLALLAGVAICFAAAAILNPERHSSREAAPVALSPPAPPVPTTEAPGDGARIADPYQFEKPAGDTTRGLPDARLEGRRPGSSPSQPTGGRPGPVPGDGTVAGETVGPERALRPVARPAPPPGIGLPASPQPNAQPAFEPVHTPGQPQLPGAEDELAGPTSHDRYPGLVENRFVRVEGQAALSTFGVDVDTASYAIVRKYLSMGQLPPKDAVRLEELVNYFPYADKPPKGDDPFAVTVELADCPWQPKHRLARIGLKAKPIATDKRPPSNLVFLIDVSGSMFEPNKLPWVKQSLRMLVGQLGENDRVAMVAYAGNTGLVLDSTSAAKKDRILEALDRLEAGGSTNGSGGIRQAYDVAAANFIKGGTNRVILCTDGDWNVGVTSTDALVKLIEEKRKTGVFLSVLGFGMGNLRGEMMVKLADAGNGNYAYIDTLREANKVLVQQLGGTLVTVAKDVKLQVEFNPAVVGAYRLLGYEKRALAAKDFHDDTKDAGEMGAGHVVTALYELVPAGEAQGANGEGLRYQPSPAPKPAPKAGRAGESFVVKMRFKKPDADTSTLRELPVTDPGKGYAEASEDFRFAAAVAAFAMLLRDSPFKGEASFALVQELADAARKHDPGGYRAEFSELVRRAKSLSGRP